MRVLFTTPYSTASVTGVGLIVRELAGRLEDAGGRAIIVEPGEVDDPRGLRNLLLALRSAWSVFCNRENVDIVHCQALHAQSLIAGLMGRALGKGVVMTVHGPSARQPGLRSLVLAMVERACVAVPHRLVVVAKFLGPMFRRRTVVILNGVPVTEIQSGKEGRAPVRRELGIKDETVLMYVGRVTADKGFWTLLEAVRMVRSKGRHDLRLVCVGPIADDVRSRLMRQPPGPWVSLIGPRPRPWRYLAAADTFLLPSTREGLPLSLLEAMALGLPAIATRVGGVPEVVKDGVTGRLVPPDDVHALAHAIEWTLDHSDEARDLGTAAAELMASSYDSAQMWKAYSRVYDEAMSVL